MIDRFPLTKTLLAKMAAGEPEADDVEKVAPVIAEIFDALNVLIDAAEKIAAK